MVPWLPMVLPEFQNIYGMSDNGTYSWGDKLSTEAPNYAKEFYRTGFTTNNSVSLAGGNDNIQAYFSYGNVYSEGMTPSNTYRSHNLNSKVGFNVLKSVHIDFSAKYTNQYVKNQAAAGFLFNPLTGVYLFPRGEDWNYYKNNYEIYDESRGINIQNWMNTGPQQYSNPYWTLNRQTRLRIATVMNSAEASSGISTRIGTFRDVCVTKEVKNAGSITCMRLVSPTCIRWDV